MLEEWIRGDEAAHLLGLKEETFWNYRQRGRLPKLKEIKKDGRYLLFKRSCLEEVKRARGHGTLSVPQAAAYLGWSQEQLVRSLQPHMFGPPYIMVGKRKRFKIKDIEKFQLDVMETESHWLPVRDAQRFINMYCSQWYKWLALTKFNLESRNISNIQYVSREKAQEFRQAILYYKNAR